MILYDEVKVWEVFFFFFSDYLVLKTFFLKMIRDFNV